MFQTLFSKKLNITSIVLSGVLLGISLATPVLAMDAELAMNAENQQHKKTVGVIFKLSGCKAADITDTTSYLDLFDIFNKLYPNNPGVTKLVATHYRAELLTEANWPTIRDIFFLPAECLRDKEGRIYGTRRIDNYITGL